MTLTIGSWGIPAAITVLAFVAAVWRCNAEQNTGGYFPAGAMLALFLMPLAAIVSLIAWLAWALLR